MRLRPNRQIQIWQVGSLFQWELIQAHDRLISDLALSPDGKLLLWLPWTNHEALESSKPVRGKKSTPKSYAVSKVFTNWNKLCDWWCRWEDSFWNHDKMSHPANFQSTKAR